MKLSFKEEYQSIKGFDDINLPDFTVLTGLNGSGKTQVLKAISLEHIRYGDIDNEQIKYLSYNDFVKGHFSHSNAERECSEFLRDNNGFWGNKIKEIYRKHLVESDAKDHHLIADNLNGDQSIWGYKQNNVNNDLWEKIEKFKNEIEIKVFQHKDYLNFTFHDHITQSYKQNGKISKDKGFYCEKILGISCNLTVQKLNENYHSYINQANNYASKQFNLYRNEGKKYFFDEYAKINPKP